MWRPIMMLVAAVGFLGTTSKSMNSTKSDANIGEEIVSFDKVPYQLSLEVYNTHICGASIISEYWAVTAAHCVTSLEPARIRLRSGSDIREEGGVLHQTVEIIIHEKYDFSIADYDVALLKVDKPFKKHEIISLATTRPKTGANSTVSGWGLMQHNGTPSKQLRWVHVPIMAQEMCKYRYGDYLTDRMICTGSPRKGCFGDAGGPMVVDEFLVGIVSKERRPCFMIHPMVFTNVAAVRDWIIENAELEDKMK